MILTHKIKLRLDSREEQPIIDAVQGDSARAVEFSLLDGAVPWVLPEGTTAMIRYRRLPGKFGGLYDTLPDGTAACSVSADKVTVFLTAQVLAVAGMTELQVTLMNGDAELTCFSVLIRVQANISDVSMGEESYVNLSEHIRHEVETAMANLDQIVVGDNSADYYESLADALADVNAGTTDKTTKVAETAKVKVYTAHDGRVTVMLLADVTEVQTPLVERSIDISLAGHTLTLDGGVYLYAKAGVDCRILGGVDPATGKRGQIVSALSAPTNGVVMLVAFGGRELVCQGVEFSTAAATTNAVYGIYGLPGCEQISMRECAVELENSSETSGGAYGVATMDAATKTVLEHCSINVVSTDSNAIAVYYMGDITVSQSTLEVTAEKGAAANVLNNNNGCNTVVSGCHMKATAVAGGTARILYSHLGGPTRISNCIAEVRAVSQGHATALLITEKGVVTVEDSTIKAVVQSNEDQQHAVAVDNYGLLQAKNTVFYADGQGGNASEDYAIGVRNLGTAHLDACTVTGTHSGLSNSVNAKLYVNGGTYTGTTHGGFYFAHGADGCAHVCDAYIRDGHYDGEFTDYWDAQEWVYWGGFYIGGGAEANNSNVQAYLDGCTMEGVKHAFTMRGSSGETNNTVYLSNCTLVDGINKPINFHNNTHHVVVGMGCDITQEMMWAPDGVEIIPGMLVFTDELYRGVREDQALTGRDYRVLAQLASSETATEEDVPSYVRAEAERVAAVVQSHQSSHTVSFMLGADIHARLGLTDGSQRSEQMLASVRHAAQAMKIIRDRVHIDFAGLLGDYLWDNGETVAQAMEMYRVISEYFAPAFCGLPQIWAKGNHDMLGNSDSSAELTDEQVFSAIGIHNSGAVFHEEDRVHGYCYRDYEEFKLRVICMNTCETRTSYAVSDAQNAWLSEALSLTGKSGWKSVILCHVPLDSWGAESTVLKNVAAYQDTILCVIHGHLHNYLIGTLAGTEIPRICIPNIDFYRTNEYGKNDTGEGTDGYIEYGQEVSYEKTADTAQDTAFCVITMDLKTGKLYADHYGAGYDRVADLNMGTTTGDEGTGGDSGAYTNQIPLATATIGGTEIFNGVGYKVGTRINSAYNEVEAAGMCCTGFIPVKVGDVIRIKNVTIYGTYDPYGCVFTAAGGSSIAFSGSQMSAATTNGITTLTVTGQSTDQLYFRLSVGVIDETSVITVNEEIA